MGLLDGLEVRRTGKFISAGRLIIFDVEQSSTASGRAALLSVVISPPPDFVRSLDAPGAVVSGGNQIGSAIAIKIRGDDLVCGEKIVLQNVQRPRADRS